MAQCISPWVKEHEGKKLDLPCGKCHACRSTRSSQWSFRLNKEAEVSSSAFFVTLTYDQPVITENGFMTLNKKDIQDFMKRLRKLNKERLKYYAVGEYGSKTMRPHYHIILFNADIETIDKAWSLNGKSLGHIHIGQVTEASTGYTLKYISKEGKIPMFELDDREKEFSLMSKRLGSNYITDQMVKWHKQNLFERMYVNLKDGKKVSMPRYYKEKIYTKYEREAIGEVNAVKREREIEEMDLSTYEKLQIEKFNIDVCKTKRQQKNSQGTKF